MALPSGYKRHQASAENFCIWRWVLSHYRPIAHRKSRNPSNSTDHGDCPLCRRPGRMNPNLSVRQLLYAKKIAQGKGLIIPDEAKANSAAMSAWIDLNRGSKRRGCSRKTVFKATRLVAPQSTAPTKRGRKRKGDKAAAPTASAQPNSVAGTQLRIPYGNKDVALKLGARYGSAEWYAPPGVDLSAFDERGVAVELAPKICTGR